MRQVRAVRRKDPPANHKGRGGMQRARFEPADGGQMPSPQPPAQPMWDSIRIRAACFAVETAWAEYHRVESMTSRDPQNKEEKMSLVLLSNTLFLMP